MKLDLYQLVIFDLDNTLYDEFDYLEKVYKKIASSIYNHYGKDEVKTYEFLTRSFKEDGRKNLFNRLMEEIGIAESHQKSFLGECLQIMRSITLKKSISMFDESYELFKNSIYTTKTCIVTNGNPQQQRNKISQIDWRGLDNNFEVFCANEYEPKPSKNVFEAIKCFYGLGDNSDVLMIGDSEIDKEFAFNIGAHFENIDRVFKK